jgi:hypothetical protein
MMMMYNLAARAGPELNYQAAAEHSLTRLTSY